MSTPTIDYAALAKQAGAISSTPPGGVDYAALAKQAGATSSTPAAAPGDNPGLFGRFSQQVLGTAHPLDQAVSEAKQLWNDPLGTLGQAVTKPVTGIRDLAYGLVTSPAKTLQAVSGGPQFAEDVGSKNYLGALGTLLGGAAQVASGRLVPAEGAATSVEEAAQRAMRTQSAAGPLAARMQETPQGEAFSRADVQNYARSQGVNLDLADVTGSAPAKAVKGYAQRSIGGSGTMAANTAANRTAIEAAADRELASYAPQGADRTTLGTAVQERLNQSLGALKSEASDQFNQLDEAVGGRQIDVSGTLQQTAQRIITQNQSYFDAHPELRPKQAWNIVQDLAAQPVAEGGAAGPKTMSWSELHQLRSDLMDVYRNSPEIVKSRSDAWIQQLVARTDEAMNGATAGLSPAEKAQFRQANATWEQIKSTYDNPRHPFYSAVRAQMPEQVTGMLANKTPTLSNQVQAALGPQLWGQFQRDFVSRLLDPNGGGVPDLAGLNARLNRLPQDYLNATLGRRGTTNLKLLAKTAQLVTANINPSGTGATVIPAAEMGGFAGAALAHPLAATAGLAGDLATGYGTARGLTSQTIIDRLTRPAGAVPQSPIPLFGAPQSAPLWGMLAAARARQGNQNGTLPFLRSLQPRQ